MLYENTDAYLIDGKLTLSNCSDDLTQGIIYNHKGYFHGTYCKDADKYLGKFYSEDGRMFRLTKGGAFELWDDKKGRNDNH